MSFLKKILVSVSIIILLFLCVNIYGCGKNNIPDISEEAIQAAAIADPATEIISGTMSYDKTKTTENTEPVINTTITETNETTEITEIISTTENFSITETTEETEDINSEELEELYVITPSGKKYHYPTCRTVKTIKQYLTKEEAEQSGYEACKICNPK